MAYVDLNEVIEDQWEGVVGTPVLFESPGGTYSGGNDADVIYGSDPWTHYHQYYDEQLQDWVTVSPDFNDGNDTISGGGGGDFVDGRGGNDYIQGNAGDDNLSGMNGSDTIYGGQNNDTVYGNTGSDSLSGDLGNDIIYGGMDDDRLSGGDGSDFLSGDSGNDLIWTGSGADTVFHSGSPPSSGFHHDYVYDFDAFAGDTVQVGAAYTTYQNGADTIVDFGNNAAVILVGVNLSTLPAGWVHF
jgi:Ca2+-binding RTX toxin-like protein